MEKIEPNIAVFNNYLEAGLRTVILLNEYYPESIDFENIVKLDYILVNSRDFDGPESLHPHTSNRKGEIFVRRDLVRDGLGLMKRLNLINVICNEQGIYYSVTGDVEPFIKLMKTEYSNRLQNNAKWCASQTNQYGFQCFNSYFMDLMF
jgi:hypothetical protein